MKGMVPILMLLTVIISFNKSIIVWEYQLNQDFLSKQLCVKKNVPQSTCKGKCQLAKLLSESEEQEQPVKQLTIASEISTFLFSEQSGYFMSGIRSPEPKNYCSYYSYSHYQSPVFSIFRPPA